MQRMHLYLGSLLLSATLVAPVGVRAGTNLQYNRQQDDRQQRDRNKNQRRVYDRDHKDYHVWDDREDGSYRQWLQGRNQKYRDFSKLKRKDQSEYWKWRHEHPDGGGDRR